MTSERGEGRYFGFGFFPSLFVVRKSETFPLTTSTSGWPDWIRTVIGGGGDGVDEGGDAT